MFARLMHKVQRLDLNDGPSNASSRACREKRSLEQLGPMIGDLNLEPEYPPASAHVVIPARSNDRSASSGAPPEIVWD